MTLEEIRRYTDTISDKHRSGKTLTEQEFNDVIKVVNIELFNFEYDLLIKASSDKNIPLNQLIIQSTSLKEFKVYNEIIPLAGSVGVVPAGTGDLPSDYRHYLYIKTNPSPSEGLKTRDVEVVDDLAFNMIQNTMYMFDLRQYPQATIYQDSFRVIPTDTTSVNIGYLKTPTNPYYDYVIKSSSGQIVYMPVGSWLNSGTLYTNSGGSSVIATGVVHPSGETTITSSTVEIEWREDMHTHFANRILLKIGIPLKDGELFQMVKTEDQS